MKSKNVLLIISLLLALSFIPEESICQDKPKGPPEWAPAHGYREKTRHVYFPEQNMYYDVEKGVYIYVNGENWEISAELPSVFKNVDLNLATKIELDLNTDEPQLYNAEHQQKYPSKHSNKKTKNKPEKGKKK